MLTTFSPTSTVTSIRTGGTEGSGTAGTLGTALNGTYGTLLVSADGTYTYTLYTQAQNASAYNTVQALDDGLTALTDVFNYTMTDGTANDTATLTISITGANDAPIAVNDVKQPDGRYGLGGSEHQSDRCAGQRYRC